MQKITQWHLNKFNELSLHQLYDILKLRVDVFVVEQNCIYPDLDSDENTLDRHENTLHLLGYHDAKLVAYLRILDQGQRYDNYISIGRVVVAEQVRATGVGHELMSKGLIVCEQHFTKQEIKISAQEHLLTFYQHHSFERVSEVYLEDDIPHIAMVRKR